MERGCENTLYSLPCLKKECEAKVSTEEVWIWEIPTALPASSGPLRSREAGKQHVNLLLSKLYSFAPGGWMTPSRHHHMQIRSAAKNNTTDGTIPSVEL